MGLEKNLYHQVITFASEKLGCHVVKQQIGMKFGHIDIVGLRHVPGDLESSFELVSIEVKEEHAPFLPSIGQAFAYSIFAHHCYLAVKKRGKSHFSQEEIQIASKFGVGLIEIKGKDCNIVLTSSQFDPPEKYTLQILARLDHFRCSLCRGVYSLKEIVSCNMSSRIDISEGPGYRGFFDKAIKTRKNLRYWLYELADARGDKRTYTYDRRYLCKDCVSLFGSLLPRGKVQ